MRQTGILTMLVFALFLLPEVSTAQNSHPTTPPTVNAVAALTSCAGFRNCNPIHSGDSVTVGIGWDVGRTWDTVLLDYYCLPFSILYIGCKGDIEISGELGDLVSTSIFTPPLGGLRHGACNVNANDDGILDTPRTYLTSYKQPGVYTVKAVLLACHAGPDPNDPSATIWVPSNIILATDTLNIVVYPAGERGPATMVDPVPDLLNGPKVVGTADTVREGLGAERLAIGGRPVLGVAADGVTQTLIKIPAVNPGDQFTVTVLDDQSAPSVHPGEDGALGHPGDMSLDVNQSEISVTAVTTASGVYAFAVYRAPADFARGGLNPLDEGAKSRIVTIQVVDANNNVSDIVVTVVRPPVVLIHGMWSSWQESWKNFAPLVTGPNAVDSRFSILRANYDTLVGPQITQSNPIYFVDRLKDVRANSLGFDYNAPAVLSQMSQWLQGFRAGANGNPAHFPVAAAQFDVIAHSMGGDIARTMPLFPTYVNKSNFGQGFVHKVITIDTPHQGTPVSSVIRDAANDCTRRWLASKAGLFALSSVIISGTTVTGAVGDLDPGSPAIQAIQGQLPGIVPPSTPPVPTALIAGVYTNWGVLDIGPDLLTEFTLKTACRHDPVVATNLTSTGWPRVFAPDNDPQGQRNDGLVGVASQLNGLGDGAGSVYTDFVHSSALTGSTGLGFVSTGVLDANTVISRRVIDLLNTPLPDPGSFTFHKLGPSSQ